jgi:putative PIN family toxin of toxin-antitoxin system
MTIVLDTNVIVAGLVTNGLCHEVLRHGIAMDAIVSSSQLLDELEQTLERKFSLTREARAFLLTLRASVDLVAPAPLETAVCRDPDDDVVLATALAGHADLIVTGDDGLLVLRSFRRIRIVSPRTFLATLTPRR